MRNLGIMIHKPGHNQKFMSIVEQAKYLPSDINLVVFYTEYGKVPYEVNFAMMELIHSYNFHGTLISTDLYTTDVLHNALQATKKYNYIWDLHHLYSPMPYSLLFSQYMNKNSELIVRSNFMNNWCSKTWRKPSMVMEDFNHEQLSRLC